MRRPSNCSHTLAREIGRAANLGVAFLCDGVNSTFGAAWFTFEPDYLESGAPAMESDYKVKLEVFEGPLDLLLFLIKRDEIDIYDISIERITRQYLDYLQAFKELNIDIAGEFIVMAANLIYLKSRSLLPADQQPPEEDAEEDDPRWGLIRQLIEYKKFKEAAAQLHVRELEQESVFTRDGGVESLSEGPLRLGEVGIFQLINAFQNVIKRIEAREDLREIFGEHFTVSDKIDVILQRLARDTQLRFSDLFSAIASRVEIVVTFLALLELIRLKQIRATQADPFGEIEIAAAAA
jgi:segregation and condensation protein A